MVEQDFYSKTRPIIEVFNSIEGEGCTAGQPTIFVRTTGCNLRCCFANSICDTAYSSFNPEKGKYSLQNVIDMLERYPFSDLSITGGEPFLHVDLVRDLVNLNREIFERTLIVETNGSILVEDLNLLGNIDIVNISPKLSSSDPTPEKLDELGIEQSSVYKTHSKNRFNIDALYNLIKYSQDYRLKYVVSCKDDFEEIEEQIQHLIVYCAQRNSNGMPLCNNKGRVIWKDARFIKPWNICLMPSGSTNEELNQNRKMVAEYCAEHGYNYTDRLQIVVWGTEKER